MQQGFLLARALRGRHCRVHLWVFDAMKSATVVWIVGEDKQTVKRGKTLSKMLMLELGATLQSSKAKHEFILLHGLPGMVLIRDVE